jgi:Protein of unknown function (DUF3151)
VSDQRPVNLSASGPPETVLDLEPADASAALSVALEQPADQRRDAVAAVAARWPRYLDAWAQLGALARDDVEAYAYFRVGYHRGLDRLRANGWRGSGYVRWAFEENRGFLRSLRGLGQSAARIGETDEAERCAHFLAQCDPGGVPEEG